MKINKLLGLGLLVTTILVGCGEGDFSEQQIKELYNRHHALKVKVKSVSNIDCKHEGYVFPEEKERPIFKCEYDLESETGQEVREKSVLMKDDKDRLYIYASALFEGSNVRY